MPQFGRTRAVVCASDEISHGHTRAAVCQCGRSDGGPSHWKSASNSPCNYIDGTTSVAVRLAHLTLQRTLTEFQAVKIFCWNRAVHVDPHRYIFCNRHFSKISTHNKKKDWLLYTQVDFQLAFGCLIIIHKNQPLKTSPQLLSCLVQHPANVRKKTHANRTGPVFVSSSSIIAASRSIGYRNW